MRLSGWTRSASAATPESRMATVTPPPVIRGAGLRAHRRVVMDERHGGYEAQRVDAGGVSEPRGAVEE